MAKVTIKKMAIENFKGQREMTVEFGHRTTVAGANATGKSTIFDAFTWCLFGKDSQDRTDHGRGAFGIKTCDEEGNVIEKLDHSVEVVFDVDGEELKVKRSLTEDWRVTNGTTEAVFAGNVFGYFWNGLPIGANEFKKRVEEGIMDEAKFKMMTNPHYFCNLPWDMQMRYVNELIGDVTYAEIAQGVEDWAAVIGNKSDADVMLMKKNLSVSKKAAAKDMQNNEADIKGINKGTPERPDEAALSIEKARLESAIEKLENEDKSAFEREKVYAKVVRAKEAKITELKLMQNSVYLEAVEKAGNDAIEANREYMELEAEVGRMTGDVRRLEADIMLGERKVRECDGEYEEKMKRMTDERDRLRNEWMVENDRDYVKCGDCVICPLTNKECDGSSAKIDMHNAQVRAQGEFNKRKEENLNAITEKGMALSREIDVLQQQHTVARDAAVAEVDKMRQELAEKNGALAEKKALLGGMKKVETAVVDKANLPKWMEIEKEIDAIEGEIESMKNDEPKEVSDDRKAAKSELKAHISEIDMELGKVKVIEDNERRICEIEKDNERLSQIYADYERDEDIIAQVNKARIEEIEKRMASTFSMVTFKFVETQINGGEVDTCIAMVDGVRYGDLNSAKKVNAGLDIINALCRRYGVWVPIFIDNAESVNELLATESQMIRLEVTDDRPMIVRIDE